jgi:hypothetical protein
MMRLTMAVWWSLALVWLLTSQVDAESAAGQAAQRIEVKGYGSSVEAAKKDALEKAVLTLEAHLRQQQFDHWQPTESYVLARLLDDPGRAADDVAIGQFGTAKTWVLALNIPGDDTLQHLDRHARRQQLSEGRMSLALRFLAALVLVLSVIVGYIRADEWTQSRYTTWLRLASGGVLVALAAAWWRLR